MNYVYELFVNNGYVNEPLYLQTNYFETIGELVGKLFLDIKDLKIPFLKVSDIIDKNKNLFLAKLKLIFMNEETGPDELYFQVTKNLEKCKIKYFN